MDNELRRYIRDALVSGVLIDPDQRPLLLQKLSDRSLLRANGDQRHCCVMWMPVDPGAGKVFLVRHRLADTWLFPGGHIEPGELPEQTLRREFAEELGVELAPDYPGTPFMITVMSIENPRQQCHAHFDLWFAVAVSQTEFTIDEREFSDARWATLEQARALLTDRNSLRALDFMPGFAPGDGTQPPPL